MKVLVKLVIPPGIAVEKEVVKLGQTVVVVRLGRFVGVLVVTLESVSIILNILSRKDFLSRRKHIIFYVNILPIPKHMNGFF